MVVADGARGLMQKVAVSVPDTGGNALEAGFRLFPVVAEPGLATHGALRLAQGRFVPIDAVQWGKIAAIA